jgi:phage baseplate assembly protein W
MASSIAYPYAFDGRGRTALAADTDHIEQMIEAVLFTSPGERVNRPTFGCGLLQMPFEPNDDRLQQTMEFLIRGALSQWLGTLIDTQSIDVARNDNVFSVTIVYLIRKTKRPQSATFERTV